MVCCWMCCHLVMLSGPCTSNFTECISFCQLSQLRAEPEEDEMNPSSPRRAEPTERWMSLTLSEHSRDFPLHTVSIFLLSEDCSAGPPSLTLSRAASGLADLSWCGRNSLAGKHCGPRAAESSGRGGRGCSPGSGR